MSPPTHGAYGLALDGVDRARDLLVRAGDGWPAFELGWRAGGGAPERQWVRPDHALLRLWTGGQVEVDRRRGRALLTLPRQPTAAELVHPYLAPVAAVAARWLGRECFHAGAVAVGDGAWGVLGDKEAGKSSLLAALALTGHRIVADDLLVVDGDGRALLGPRAIDLRDDAARRLGVAGAGADRPGRRRLAIRAPGSPPRLRGFVVLRWGDACAVTRVPVARRLGELAARRAVAMAPRDPRPLLALAGLPMVELERPRSWRASAEAPERLLDALAA